MVGDTGPWYEGADDFVKWLLLDFLLILVDLALPPLCFLLFLVGPEVGPGVGWLVVGISVGADVELVGDAESEGAAVGN